MGKTIAMTGKFAESECDQIDTFARMHDLSRSAAIHYLVMEGLKTPTDKGDSVTFKFLENFAYFWKDREYKGFLRDGKAHILFGGDWLIYDVDKIPVEIIGG